MAATKGDKERGRLNTQRSHSIIAPESATFNSTLVLSLRRGAGSIF